MKHIIQHGTDGLGHQLHGLFSCLLLHNISNYYFDGFIFVNKPFNIQDIKDDKINYHTDICKNYIIEIVKLFIEYYKIQPINYSNHTHSHEVYNIPSEYDINTIYSLDNAYYFDKINLNYQDTLLHNKNISIIKNFFINKYLPINNLNNNNIVIHIRRGDALWSNNNRKNSLLNHTIKVCKLIDIFNKLYPNYTYYIHSDGDLDLDLKKKLDLFNINYNFYDKTTNIMNIISHFIYAKIFVCDNSALSKVCCFLGNKELTIINDDNKHSMPLDVIKISDYINNQN